METKAGGGRTDGRLDWMRRINLAGVAVLALWFLLLPGLWLARDLADPALRGPGGIPRVAWRVHKSLTPRYEAWARNRLASGVAAHLNLYDVPSTEWPMFGSVFYLAATEALQEEWERHPQGPAPRDYARGAVEACADLITDPVHHTWVRQHWGDGYLHRENVFFRAMLIQGLTSYERLTGDRRHRALLADQAETLAADLAASPHGWLHDYPAECYPIDVFAAVWSIRRADSVLGTDRSAFVTQALRAFSGPMLDSCGLPPYIGDPASGVPGGPSRGIGNSYVLIYAPELYPDVARQWYDAYVQNFWQNRIGAAGFREYPKGMPGHDWLMDQDSGPVMWGFSPSGNAFGVAAARANGRFDHAWPLSGQVLAAAWPLPDGGWLGPRILSSVSGQHAPLLGEANLLFLLTRQPAAGVPLVTGGSLPPIVWGFFAFYLGLGGLLLFIVLRCWRRPFCGAVPLPRFQAFLWLGMLALAAGLWFSGLTLFAVAVLFPALCMPCTARHSGKAPSACTLPS